MASLTPFRFSWTQDRGNDENPVPFSPCPHLHSIAPMAAKSNVGRNARNRGPVSGGWSAIMWRPRWEGIRPVHP